MPRTLHQTVSAAALIVAATSAQAVETTAIPLSCLNPDVSQLFDFGDGGAWLNRKIDPNESRFNIGPIAAAIMQDFTTRLTEQGQRMHVIAFPDTALFAPQGAVADPDGLLPRFEVLYHRLNTHLDSVGFHPVGMSWLAHRNRFTQDLHRGLDHHLTSKGRFLLANHVARRFDGAVTLPDLPLTEASYDALPREAFQVWQRTALNYVTSECRALIESLPYDERVTLPVSDAADEGPSLDSLFGDAPAEDGIALLGTSQSLSADGNFADMIAAATDRSVTNYSEAGGGASTALQFAAFEGVIFDPAVPDLIWEVATDFSEARLTGSILAADGMAQPSCAEPLNVGPETLGFARWTDLDLPTDRVGVLRMPNTDHTKGMVRLRISFADSKPLELEIWRWSQTQDPGRLGDWAVAIPDFAALGLPVPTNVQVRYDGLYEYQPSGEIAFSAGFCAL